MEKCKRIYDWIVYRRIVKAVALLFLFGILLFCQIITIMDVFRPGLAWCIYNCKWLYKWMIDIRNSGIYTFLSKFVNGIASNIIASKSLIGMIGLSGTAIQITSDVRMSRYPGLEMHTIFRWRYPGYRFLYLLHIGLMLFGCYSLDVELKRSATFCQIGVMASFVYSLRILLFSSTQHNSKKFIEPYVRYRVNQYAKYTSRRIPLHGTPLFESLIYHVPYAAGKTSNSVSGLNRGFEELIRRNEQIWSDLLGRCSQQSYKQQTDASSLLLRVVLDSDVKDNTMQITLFASGLLMWLHNSVPYSFSPEDRWRHISQFLADVHAGLYRNENDSIPKRRKQHTTGVTAYGIPESSYGNIEYIISAIALNLLYIESLLWQPMSDDVLSDIAERIKKGVCLGQIKPSVTEEQRMAFVAYSIMVYHAIACVTFDEVTLPSRGEMRSVIEYLFLAVRW